MRRPAILMVLGLLFLAGAGFIFASDDGGGGETAAADACLFPPCRAAENPVPVRGYENSSITVDPRDPNHMIVMANDLIGARCTWHVTFDGGRDWDDHAFEIPPGYTRCGLESAGHLSAGNVTFGPSGTVYAVIASAGGLSGDVASEKESVLLYRSTDGGRTFGPATVAAKPPSPEIAWVRPHVVAVAGAAGRDQLLLSMWECKPDPNTAQRFCDGGRFSRSDDGGSTFTAPALVTPPPGGNSPSQAAKGKDGSIYMLFLRRLVAGGTTELHVAKSVDGGATFVTQQIDVQPAIGIERDSAKLVADPNSGALYTVFTDSRTGRPQLFFRRSVDNGATWEQAVILGPNQNSPSSNPQISVAPNGRIDVVFYSARAEKSEDVYWIYSSDGGGRFVPRQLNDQPINRELGYRDEVGGFYPPGVASMVDGAVFSWSDTTFGTDFDENTQDINVRRTELQDP